MYRWGNNEWDFIKESCITLESDADPSQSGDDKIHLWSLTRKTFIATSWFLLQYLPWATTRIVTRQMFH